MNEEATMAQAAQMLNLLTEKGVSINDLRTLSDGYFADLLDAIRKGSIPERDILRGMLGLPCLEYPITVNMRLTPKEMIDECDFDHFDAMVFKLLPFWREYNDARVQHIANLVNLDNVLSNSGGLSMLLSHGVKRFATARELLAFAGQHRLIQMKCRIIAMDPMLMPKVLVLSASACKRILSIEEFKEKGCQRACFRLLAVQK